MSKINKTTRGNDYRKDPDARLAGGYGNAAAVQEAEGLLRRAVMANLLWEDNFYQDGTAIASRIAELVPQVPAQTVFDIALAARHEQKLRHVPLLLAREMARHPDHRALLGTLLPRIITRADQITEFVALYWKDGKEPLAKQVKVGLAGAFTRFNEYQLAKYDRADKIRLRDVLFLVHGNPNASGPRERVPSVERENYKRGAVWRDTESLYAKLTNGNLAAPDTWEVGLSAAEDDDAKRAVWERLLTENKLGALAFLRNLRNMEKVGVGRDVILHGFETVNPGWLVPINYFAAAHAAPDWEREIETLMLRGLAQMPKLPGLTILLVDVSGSMNAELSAQSDFTRLAVGGMLASVAAEVCEHIKIYATAGSDGRRTHDTEKLKPRRGFALVDDIAAAGHRLGGGGIFTRQALEYVRAQEQGTPERIIVFSDSQDMDYPNQRVPAPFGQRNYIVDVSAHTRGINYKGVWTAEISGWSDQFLRYIAATEGVQWSAGDEDTQNTQNTLTQTQA